MIYIDKCTADYQLLTLTINTIQESQANLKAGAKAVCDEQYSTLVDKLIGELAEHLELVRARRTELEGPPFIETFVAASARSPILGV